VLLWGRGEPEFLTAAVRSAGAGRPTVLVVEGEPGVGKTTLLDELVRRAGSFHVLSADGLEDEDVPFGVLAQWGVDLRVASDGRLASPFDAARGLRDLVDGTAAVAGRVLVRLDDLQWADSESVKTLTWLLRRVCGDRLLVAVATRPLPPGVHSGWRRWVAAADHATRITLAGLTEADARTLIRAHWPAAPESLARRLWEHTGGNPLYLTAILDEYDPALLTDAPVLPAPAEFARLLRERLERLPGSAVDLLEATAVLGTGWISLFDAAAVGQVEHAARAAETLVDAGLVQVRASPADATIRVAHSLIHSAAYQRTPVVRRQALHERAAGIVSQEGAVLDHRLAAAEQYDDALAADLESHAHDLHLRGSYRLAALSLRRSSALTADARERERRWLDSLFESALARDFATVGAGLPDVERAADTGRRILVQGTVAVLRGRWRDAVAVLEPGTRGTVGTDDPLTRHRIEVLLAWSRVGTGCETRLILEGLERARSLGVADPAVGAYGLFAQGQAAARVHGPHVLLRDLATMPELPTSVPAGDAYLLAWRGALRTHVGFLTEAVRDLREVQRQVRAGLTDIADGGFHGILGVAHWLNGEWDLARMCFRLALEVSDVSQEFILPLVLTYVPLATASAGDFTEADRLLDRATAVVQDMPWQEAVQSLFIASVVRAHAGGTPAQQAALLPGMRARWPDVPVAEGLVGGPWLMHGALAAVWAGELSEAERFLERMSALAPQPPWVRAAVAWLRGLVAEARGEDARALAHLVSSVDPAAAQLPFYRGHGLVDHARLAHRLGDTAGARTSLRRAAAVYRGLGAAPYVERVAVLLADRPLAPAQAPTHPALTDRERDVLTLVTSGMSYAQISRDLFITRSTVGFHLSNIYAKTGVSSRHELSELVRRGSASPSSGRS
jgi:DNA-binding CsgD family transcriptional regulator